MSGGFKNDGYTDEDVDENDQFDNPPPSKGSHDTKNGGIPNNVEMPDIAIHITPSDDIERGPEYNGVTNIQNGTAHLSPATAKKG